MFANLYDKFILFLPHLWIAEQIFLSNLSSDKTSTWKQLKHHSCAESLHHRSVFISSSNIHDSQACRVFMLGCGPLCKVTHLSFTKSVLNHRPAASSVLIFTFPKLDMSSLLTARLCAMRRVFVHWFLFDLRGLLFASLTWKHICERTLQIMIFVLSVFASGLLFLSLADACWTK